MFKALTIKAFFICGSLIFLNLYISAFN